MIVIKIKTWKDYKKQLLDWLKEPRREICKEYIRVMEQKAQDEVDKWISASCDANGIRDDVKINLISSAQRGIIEARNETLSLIEEYQPKGVFN